MRPVKKPKPWSDEALDALMKRVAVDVEARAAAARERLSADPVERARVIAVISRNGFTLDENLQVVPLEDSRST